MKKTISKASSFRCNRVYAAGFGLQYAVHGVG